jgi:asparagine synthase (glutamine-hydrolysing)
MRLDALYTLPDDYLQKVDVASMAFSLEARDPLLDQELVEWAMRLPLRWKLRFGENKYLLRRLLHRYVPASLVDRPKRGFGVPIDRWLRGPLRAWAQERIRDAGAFAALPISRVEVQRLLALHLSGRRDVHPLLWAILMLLDSTENRPQPSREAGRGAALA